MCGFDGLVKNDLSQDLKSFLKSRHKKNSISMNKASRVGGRSVSGSSNNYHMDNSRSSVGFNNSSF